MAAVALIIIVAHGALVPLGNWRYDEYDTFRNIRDGGLSFVWARIVGWGPRPVSEILLYGYGTLVEKTGQPNVGLVLGALWLVLIMSVMGPILCLARRERAAFRPVATIGVVLLAMFLVGRRIDEVFYWTQGAAAYITTLAAIALIAMLHVKSRRISPTGQLAASCLGLVAAFSSEMGASFAIMYGVLMFVAMRFHREPQWRLAAPQWSDLQFLLPVIGGLSIFYLSAGGRLGVSMEAVGDPSIVHQIVPSLRTAIAYAPSEVFSLGPATNGSARYLWGIFVVLTFCGGVFGLLAASGLAADGATSLRLLAVGVSVLAAVVVSVLAAYYQFGLVCCSRHETMRRCLALVAALCLMAFLYSLLAGRLTTWIACRRVVVGSCFLLLGPMVGSSLVTAPYLLADLRNYRELHASRRTNWDNGTADRLSMSYLPSKSQMVCSPGSLTPGRYRLGENMPPHVTYLAKYFRKSEIVIAGNDEVCTPF